MIKGQERSWRGNRVGRYGNGVAVTVNDGVVGEESVQGFGMSSQCHGVVSSISNCFDTLFVGGALKWSYCFAQNFLDVADSALDSRISQHHLKCQGEGVFFGIFHLVEIG